MGGNGSSTQLSYDEDDDRNGVSFVKGIRLSDKVINRMKESPMLAPCQCQENGYTSSFPPKPAISLLTEAPAPTLEIMAPLLTQPQPLISSVTPPLPLKQIQTPASPPISLPASSPSAEPASTLVTPHLVQPTKLIPPIRFNSPPFPVEPVVLPPFVEPITPSSDPIVLGMPTSPAVESLTSPELSLPKIDVVAPSSVLEAVAPTVTLKPVEVPSPDTVVLASVPCPAVESLISPEPSPLKMYGVVSPSVLEAVAPTLTLEPVEVSSPDPVVSASIPCPAVESLISPESSPSKIYGVVSPSVLEAVVPTLTLEPLGVPSPDLVVLVNIPCLAVDSLASPEPPPPEIEVVVPPSTLEAAAPAVPVQPVEVTLDEYIVPVTPIEPVVLAPPVFEPGLPIPEYSHLSMTSLPASPSGCPINHVDSLSSPPPSHFTAPVFEPIAGEPVFPVPPCHAMEFTIQTAPQNEPLVHESCESMAPPLPSAFVKYVVGPTPPIIEDVLPISTPSLPPAAVDEEALNKEIKEDLQQSLEHEMSLKRQKLHLQLEEVKVQANAAIQSQIQGEVRLTLEAEQVAYREVMKQAIMKERMKTEDEMLMAQLYWMELKAYKLDEKERELKKQSVRYTEHISKLEERNGLFLKVTANNFKKGKEEAHNHFKRIQIKPLCDDLQSQILGCYRENPKKTLSCSRIALAYMQCVDSAKQKKSIGG